MNRVYPTTLDQVIKKISVRIPKTKNPLQFVDNQLPLWPESVRAMPNDICRSAIFTVRNKRMPRASIQNQLIFVAFDDVSITYTGIELRAEDDELVFLQILDVAKNYPLGMWVNFTSYQICKYLDWPTNGSYYRKIHECLLRLKATAIAVTNKRLGRGKAISMIADYEWEESEQGKRTNQRVKLSPGMDKLFAGNHYTHLEWLSYRGLTPIARRLYDYAASHGRPYPLKLETVRKMCNSDSMIDKRWRQQIVEACNELELSGLVKQAYVSKVNKNYLVNFER